MSIAKLRKRANRGRNPGRGRWIRYGLLHNRNFDFLTFDFVRVCTVIWSSYGKLVTRAGSESNELSHFLRHDLARGVCLREGSL